MSSACHTWVITSFRFLGNGKYPLSPPFPLDLPWDLPLDLPLGSYFFDAVQTCVEQHAVLSIFGLAILIEFHESREWQEAIVLIAEIHNMTTIADI